MNLANTVAEELVVRTEETTKAIEDLMLQFTPATDALYSGNLALFHSSFMCQ